MVGVVGQFAAVTHVMKKFYENVEIGLAEQTGSHFLVCGSDQVSIVMHLFTHVWVVGSPYRLGAATEFTTPGGHNPTHNLLPAPVV